MRFTRSSMLAIMTDSAFSTMRNMPSVVIMSETISTVITVMVRWRQAFTTALADILAM